MTDAKTVRKSCYILAINGAAPLDFWLALPVRELRLWVEVNNEVISKRKKQ